MFSHSSFMFSHSTQSHPSGTTIHEIPLEYVNGILSIDKGSQHTRALSPETLGVLGNQTFALLTDLVLAELMLAVLASFY
jgi:hypothetical protein